MPVSGQKNRGAREDSLQILGSVEPLSKKPPLQNQGFKWWEHVTEIWAVATNIYIEETFPNGVQYDMASAIQLMHNMMVVHAKAVIAYKEAGYEGRQVSFIRQKVNILMMKRKTKMLKRQKMKMY